MIIKQWLTLLLPSNNDNQAPKWAFENPTVNEDLTWPWEFIFIMSGTWTFAILQHSAVFACDTLVSPLNWVRHCQNCSRISWRKYTIMLQNTGKWAMKELGQIRLLHSVNPFTDLWKMINVQDKNFSPSDKHYNLPKYHLIAEINYIILRLNRLSIWI